MIWCPSEEAAWSMKSLEYEKPGLWCEKQIIAVWPQQPGVAHALPHSWGQFYSFWYKYVRVNMLQYTNTTHNCFACTPLQFRGHFFHCVCRNTNIIQKKHIRKTARNTFGSVPQCLKYFRWPPHEDPHSWDNVLKRVSFEKFIISNCKICKCSHLVLLQVCFWQVPRTFGASGLKLLRRILGWNILRLLILADQEISLKL